MFRSSLVLSAFIMAVGLFAVPGIAEVILSVTMIRGSGSPTLSSSTSVGAPVEGGSPADNWNNVSVNDPLVDISGPDGGGSFVDADGNSLSSDFSFDLDGINERGNGNSGAEQIIQRNYLEAATNQSDGNQDFVLSDTAALFDQGDLTIFDLVIYAAMNANLDTASETGTVTVEMDTDSSKTGSASFDGDDQGDGNFIEGVDYFVISGLTASTGDLAFDVFGTANPNGSGIGGFQLVETGVIPEPATAGLLGLAGLALIRRRRRA